ncbi:MAG TPA: hypothetical protein VEJ84_05560 [Acidimicrobiales bacterium]|nr:hypothetical protein [Acidimicrobiales bacterium]
MENFSISSIDDPIGSDAEASLAVSRLVARIPYLGIWPELQGEQVINGAFLDTLFHRLSRAGLAREDLVKLAHAGDIADFRRLFEHALEVTEQSPLPNSEWAPVSATLGDDLLASLLGVSPASLRRYKRSERVTPDDVAARLHFLALVVSDLSGSYNEYGVRRWFGRPRLALGSKSPAVVLAGGFEPSGDGAKAVSQLAADLVGAGAA